MNECSNLLLMIEGQNHALRNHLLPIKLANIKHNVQWVSVALAEQMAEVWEPGEAE